MPYPYASGRLLHDRNTYFYSAFHGQATITGWLACRAAAQNTPLPAYEVTPTRRRLSSPLDAATLDKLVQRFEVTKRLHDDYRPTWRAVDKTRFEDLESYQLFARQVADAYAQTGKLWYLNALLKVNDTLTALGILPADLRAIEQRLVMELGARAPLGSTTACAPQRWNTTPAPPRVIPGFSAILCASARARAYIQRLVMLGLIPERVIFLGEDVQSGTAPQSPQEWHGVFLPDLTEPATTTCARAGIPITQIAAPDVNDPAVRAALRDQGGGFTLYAGLGGQIVSAETLDCGVRFLHLHSGWVPDYRGSTTLYYALLNGQRPAVSAIWLDREIDTGPVLKRQSYPIPDAGMDVDQLYDASIRTDLMGQIVTRIIQEGADRLIPEAADGTEGVYYVIHPILKHIALMALNGMRADIPEP